MKDGTDCELHWNDGQVYTGEFQMGKMHGQGVLKNGENTIYEGEWKEGK